MHEWHTSTSTSILALINEFQNFEFDTDYDGRNAVKNVRVTDRLFNDEVTTRDFITRISYGSDTAFLATYTSKKLSKAFQKCFAAFKAKYKEYTDFKDNLTIAYGRKSSKVTCPTCESVISLSHGKRFNYCPVCGSKKIISDSNWKTLDTKRILMIKASERLETEAVKCGVTFMCGIEWHC